MVIIHVLFLSKPDEYAGLRYEPKLVDLINEIAMKLPDKWKEIGRGLGLEEHELKKIKLEEQTINDIFSTVFTQWYNGEWTTLL